MRESQTATRARGPAPPRQVVTLRMPTELHTELRALSVFMGVTVNDLVQSLIVDFLESEGRARLKEAINGLLPASVDEEATRIEEGI